MKKRKIIKKIIYSAITIFAVLVFNYLLFRVLPGDPLAMMLRNPKATPEMIEATKQFFGLDKPWYVQFCLYFKNLFSGDLGMSFYFKKSVVSVIGARIMPTIIMVGLAEVIAIIVGIILGIIAAWKRGTKIDVERWDFLSSPIPCRLSGLGSSWWSYSA